MRRFLRHLLAVALLPAAILLGGEAVLLGSGELWPLGRVLAFQRAEPGALYLRALDQAFYAYKYRGIVERRPEVLVAGSSRTMKFRAGMFGDLAPAFFNAGGMINSLRDLDDFAGALPSSMTPRVLIVGVDMWWLNDRVVPVYSFTDEIAKRIGFSVDEHIVALRWLFTHPGSVAAELRLFARRQATTLVGIAAREKGGGFRPDGSYKSPIAAPAADQPFVDRESPPIIERVTEAAANFPPSDGLSRDRVELLDRVLGALAARGTLVVGYLPPFSSAVSARLESDPRHHALWSQFRRGVPDLFARHGFPVVDASLPPTLDMDDRALSDGFHAEETFHLHVVRVMLRDDRVRAALPGAAAAVERALASPGTNQWEADLGGAERAHR